jgi:CubicO group peptidase (beta-lactamase class C family)
MKHIIIIICILFFSLALSNVHENNYRYNINKKLYWQIKKRTKYIESFCAVYVSDKNTDIYTHNTHIYRRYDIASITKVFTALTILQLHEEGKLDIDHYVGAYISIYDHNITIRHLITHSFFRPYGEKSSYSNLNYVLLKDIIEKASCKSYAENIESRFLKPLEMNDTNATGSNGAGSIVSTMNDLIKFSKMLLNKGKYKGRVVLSEKVYEMLLAPAHERKYLDWYWSSGGFEVMQHKSFYKSGRYYESISGIEIFPEKRKALIYIGSNPNCLKPWVARWRDRMWRFLRLWV